MAVIKVSAEATEAQIMRILMLQDTADKDKKLIEGYRKRIAEIDTEMEKMVLDPKGIATHALVQGLIADGEQCLRAFKTETKAREKTLVASLEAMRGTGGLSKITERLNKARTKHKDAEGWEDCGFMVDRQNLPKAGEDR